MSLIRPEAAALLHRHRETLTTAATALFGLWVLTRGGWFWGAVGLALVLVGLGLLVAALQRLRFAAPADGPGTIEIDEGQIAWFGPGIGGFVSLAELAEIGLIRVQGIRVWRLRQADGQVLLVPVAAEGAARLFDALTTLPGVEGNILLTALERDIDSPFLWRRSAGLRQVTKQPPSRP